MSNCSTLCNMIAFSNWICFIVLKPSFRVISNYWNVLSYVLCYRHIARVIKTHHLSKDQVETLQRVLKTYEKQLSGDYMLNIADICAEHSKKQLYVIFENCEVIAWNRLYGSNSLGLESLFNWLRKQRHTYISMRVYKHSVNTNWWCASMPWE